MIVTILLWLYFDWSVLRCLTEGCQRWGLLIAGSTLFAWINIFLPNIRGVSVRADVHIVYSGIIYASLGLVCFLSRRMRWKKKTIDASDEEKKGMLHI